MKPINKIVSIAIIIAVTAVFIFLGCKKDEVIDNVISDQPNSAEGVYIGNTYQINKWANPMDGYNEQDTIFSDTFFVSFVSNDTILFMNKDVNWKFQLDTSNYYMEWYGTNSNREFELYENDSLSVKYWSYGGNGTSFNQINLEFKGMKQ